MLMRLRLLAEAADDGSYIIGRDEMRVFIYTASYQHFAAVTITITILRAHATTA